jgi:hypothetical protein
MEIELVPAPGDRVAAAVAIALRRAGIDVSGRPADAGPWRRAALAEGVARGTGDPQSLRTSGTAEPPF